MTIEYALTRTEIAQGFFRSLRTSPRFLITICCYAFTFSFIELLVSGAFSRQLTMKDAQTAAITALAFFVFMPVFLFLRGKTSVRSLTISPDGIATEIGKIKTTVPWSKIKIVSPTEHGILVASASGNAFFIPNRAFSGLDHKSVFVSKINTWISE